MTLVKLKVECPACHGKGVRLHSPNNTGWHYDIDSDPANLWPDSSQQWRDEFWSKVIRKVCEPCGGSGETDDGCNHVQP